MGDTTKNFGFLLIPGFPLMAYASAVEPLRTANLLAGRTLYQWHHYAPDGKNAISSSGASIKCEPLEQPRHRLSTLLVCAGLNPSLFDHQPTLAWLRRIERSGTLMGAISGGPFVLAKAGLLNNRRYTIHWEHAAAIREIYPDHLLEQAIYVKDRNRITCAGGIAPLDMMHALIAEDHGHAFAQEVSDWHLHTQIRPATGPQKGGLAERYRVRRQDMLIVLEMMENNLSEPLALSHLSAAAECSNRQIERLFKDHFGQPLMAVYRQIRLEHARQLIQQSGLALTEIAHACGFASLSHFSTAYKKVFGIPPMRERLNQTQGHRGPQSELH